VSDDLGRVLTYVRKRHLAVGGIEIPLPTVRLIRRLTSATPFHRKRHRRMAGK
jgi:hypothetical protein